MVRYSFNNLKNVVADFGLARNEVSASVREIFSERKKLLCQLENGCEQRVSQCRLVKNKTSNSETRLSRATKTRSTKFRVVNNPRQCYN
jgi:hypothetical protein